MENKSDIPNHDNNDFLKGLNQEHFKAPENYFDQFSSDLQARIDREELLAVAPMLASMSRQEPFLAPENYFNTLRITVPTKSSPSILRSIFRPKLAFAALAIFIVASTVVFVWPNDTASEPLTFSDISTEEYDSYVEEMAPLDFNDDELIELLAADQSKKTEKEKDELEQYILDEMDMNQLMNEINL